MTQVLYPASTISINGTGTMRYSLSTLHGTLANISDGTYCRVFPGYATGILGMGVFKRPKREDGTVQARLYYGYESHSGALAQASASVEVEVNGITVARVSSSSSHKNVFYTYSSTILASKLSLLTSPTGLRVKVTVKRATDWYDTEKGSSQIDANSYCAWVKIILPEPMPPACGLEMGVVV